MSDATIPETVAAPRDFFETGKKPGAWIHELYHGSADFETLCHAGSIVMNTLKFDSCLINFFFVSLVLFVVNSSFSSCSWL